MDQFNAYIEAHKERFLDEYFNLLRVPSVSAQSTGIIEAATMVQQRLTHLGVEDARLIDTGGAPAIHGTLGSGSKRLLIYDHYDVQPVEPLDLWESPPFEPTKRDGNIYARGASDNKGNLMMRIQAIEAWVATQGELPYSIAFVFEGEEEIGSPHLPDFCRNNADLLQADGCIWETGEIDASERPQVTCGVKGMLYVELKVRSASTDAHSSLAPVVPSAPWRLIWALSTLKKNDKKVLIPDFYEHVLPPTEAEKKALKSIPDNSETLISELGLASLIDNVRSTKMLRRLFLEPTCTICGLDSGYTGPGSKTVLPAQAHAKVDFRLVPDMDPDDILAKLRKHLDTQGFTDIEIESFTKEHPARTDLNAAIVQSVQTSAKATYGVSAVVYPTMTGTGPMYALCQALGTPACSGPGCGYYGSRIHAPNEHIRERDYWKSMEWMGRFLQDFAA